VQDCETFSSCSYRDNWYAKDEDVVGWYNADTQNSGKERWDRRAWWMVSFAAHIYDAFMLIIWSLLGELTDIGRQVSRKFHYLQGLKLRYHQSTYNFGLALRKLYVNKLVTSQLRDALSIDLPLLRLAFIPDVLEDTRNAYFRSTNMPRTIESLQQIMHGLYPNEKCLEHAYPSFYVRFVRTFDLFWSYLRTSIARRNQKDENLNGNTLSCKRLEILQVSFAKGGLFILGIIQFVF
jgi:hypothetical protein